MVVSHVERAGEPSPRHQDADEDDEMVEAEKLLPKQPRLIGLPSQDVAVFRAPTQTAKLNSKMPSSC